jgi:hypothetical protein
MSAGGASIYWIEITFLILGVAKYRTLRAFSACINVCWV